MNINRVFIASDHAGFDLKEGVKQILADKFDIVDLGCDSSQTSVDYPDFAHSMAANIQDNDFGILICGTGIGISIAANRHSNIRCGLCHDVKTAKLAREHNDANVIAFGGRICDIDLAKDMLEVFFSTQFAGGRHKNRVEKINLKENK